MNESTTLDFGIFTPIDFYDSEEINDGIWSFKYSITNLDPGYQESIDVVRGYFFDGSMGYVSYFQDPWQVVGPKQTIDLETLFSNGDRTFNVFSKYPKDFQDTIKPSCVVIYSIEWRDQTGKKNKALMNVVSCKE